MMAVWNYTLRREWVIDMTLADIYSMLTGINGFENKVAYRAFPEGEAPALPFICYLDTQTYNFIADNKVYSVIQEIDIELYSKLKDTASEALIEAAFAANSIVWEKYDDYLEDEKVYEVIYTITTNQ